MPCGPCSVDSVALSDIPTCAWRALTGTVRDLIDGRKPVATALTEDDRAYYLLGLLMLVLAVRALLLRRPEHERCGHDY